MCENLQANLDQGYWEVIAMFGLSSGSTSLSAKVYSICSSLEPFICQAFWVSWIIIQRMVAL